MHKIKAPPDDQIRRGFSSPYAAKQQEYYIMPSIPSVHVENGHYVGVTTLADIRGNCPNPKSVEQSTEKDREKYPDIARAFKQRSANQRQFNAARCKRVDAYSQYIDEVRNKKRFGYYPPITLWTEDELVYEGGLLHVPGSTILTANDGETQLAARYALAAEDPKWLDAPFAVTICIGSSKEEAQQILHDMNYYATPVNEKETAPLNVEGATTKAINRGIKIAGYDDALIKPKTEKVTANYATTRLILLHGAIGVVFGAEAFNKSTRSMIKECNKQFGDLGNKAEDVSMFVAEVLRLPHDTLSTIGSDQMLALGVRFSQTRRLLAPMNEERYKQLDEALKVQREGKRATVMHRAIAVYEKLAA